MIFQNCESDLEFPATFYACQANFPDSSATHPKANIYQEILDRNQRNGLVGAVLLVKDQNGLWQGASGKADLASNVDMQSCNTFLIASISKVFTSAAVYRYVERGILSLDDPIRNWLDAQVVDKVKNAETAQIQHLLAHTSGIADYYTTQFDLDRINRANDWTKEEVLEYVYGKSPSNGVGETYYYSNTNFLLLAMILERASGKSFEQIYQEEVFDPLGLSSAYYSESQPIPAGAVKGYVDLYDNGQFAESDFLYREELGIGGDGGVAINAYDLAVFLEQLGKGGLLSQSSLDQMFNWFPLPEDYIWEELGQEENGFGIEKFNTRFGFAIGHTGGIDGFSTYAFYFPEQEATYVLLINTAGIGDTPEVVFQEVIEEM
ncbi:MAG: serine hydrolase domain-containing protein, partial [Bacteroidota bacterium]